MQLASNLVTTVLTVLPGTLALWAAKAVLNRGNSLCSPFESLILETLPTTFYWLLQDLMYEPVALACGHKFCSKCAITAAGHADSASVVRFRDLARVPTRSAACPMCRAQFVAQGEVGVFEAAVELPHVGQLIRQRCVVRARGLWHDCSHLLEWALHAGVSAELPSEAMHAALIACCLQNFANSYVIMLT